MARIVLGLASSHSTMAHAPPALWDIHARGFDFKQTDLLGLDGRLHDYPSLLAIADPALAEKARIEHFADRHRRLQAAIARLAELYAAARPDVAVIVGEDQREVFNDDNMPALLVYTGSEIVNNPRETPTTLPAELQASMRAAAWAYGTAPRTFPVATDRALDLVGRLIDAEFDVSVARRLARAGGVGHAFAFVYHRIMAGAVPPHIPVMLNTYYPPNQFTPRRAWRLGLALRHAIDAWPAHLRVAVIASGGLSHFVIDEALDRSVLAAMHANDGAALQAVPRAQMHAGSSEILNWIAAAGALGGMAMETIDYVPCYRSPAGTGVGMAFAAWR